jgi:hypothetical protein
MGYSTIMVYYDLDRTNDGCLRIATDLAKHFNAKLVGIAADNPEPPQPHEQQPLARELAPQSRSNITERLEPISKLRMAVDHL